MVKRRPMLNQPLRSNDLHRKLSCTGRATHPFTRHVHSACIRRRNGMSNLKLGAGAMYRSRTLPILFVSERDDGAIHVA